jgi:hypothetical protein
LLEADADIEAYGSVLVGSAPLSNASVFGQWAVARRLVERGAIPDDFTLAGLGMFDDLYQALAVTPPEHGRLGELLWGACYGLQREIAQQLGDRSAYINHIPEWEESTPLGATSRGRHGHLLPWAVPRRPSHHTRYGNAPPLAGMRSCPNQTALPVREPRGGAKTFDMCDQAASVRCTAGPV